MKLFIAALALSHLCVTAAFAAETLSLLRLESTPLFPRAAEGQPPRQLVRLHLNNPGAALAAVARITLGTQPAETQDLGTLAKGMSVATIRIPDLATPAPLRVELLTVDGRVFASRREEWQPPKKWTLYCTSYSHQDHGYGDYPHRLRTSVRNENISRSLRFCRETDRWPNDAQYRYNIETSETLTSFIGFQGKDAARELARRMAEGRIQLMGLHNTANTELYGHELMARQFYMSGRHAVDLLGVPAGRTIQNTDVVGLTWPLATYAKEAGFDYAFHGFNGGCMPDAKVIGENKSVAEVAGAGGGARRVFAPANEPAFWWQGPDGAQVLRRATPYGDFKLLPAHGEVNLATLKTSPERVEQFVRAHENIQWPFTSILSQDGFDFDVARLGLAQYVRLWNAEYAWPRIRMATFDDYFRALQEEISTLNIKLNTVAADENNQWSDQAYAHAASAGQARRLSESLPATETLASLAQAVSGGGADWLELFQGYNRLLQYFEHTEASSRHATVQQQYVWRETELEENREMVAEAAGYQQQVFIRAAGRLAGAITRTAERNLIVFNPLPLDRTDIVRAEIAADSVVDPITGTKLPVQQLPDGTALFIAENIPATGYKAYALAGAPPEAGAQPESILPAGATLESRFYKLKINPVTGALSSLFDKALGVELVETNAPHAFNEYLYEFRSNTRGLEYDSQWSRLEKADAITVRRGPVADLVTVTGRAGGVRHLKQTILLYHDLPRVDFGIWLDKAPFEGSWPKQHEAVFVALPFAIPDFTIRHELPGCVAEPFRQQVGGSATCHYAIRSFTDFSNDRYGVTVSPVEGALVCYGAPTSAPVLPGKEYNFRRDQAYPGHSRLHLYLLNNMFDTNVSPDQQGPVSFQWALRSHAGDWKAGGADRFGRSVLQPLLAWRADAANQGFLPASGSFMAVDAPNVTCSVIKAAEANGRGFIIRLNETTGSATTATVSLPLLPPIEAVWETSLVENDRTVIGKGNTFKVVLRPFAVTTLRISCAARPITVTSLKAEAVADMEVKLNWKSEGSDLSHFNIYRDTGPDCAPTQLNFIGQSLVCAFLDRPQVHPGGWIRSCLAPGTTYYYRVVPVDRANNPGAPGPVAIVATPSSAQTNLPPVAVEGLRAVLISPTTRDNFVNLLFRTACEPDVACYEIHRGARTGFTPDAGTRIGIVKSDDLPPATGGYDISRSLYKVREYDHATFADKTVQPATTYYYKIRAVDAAGQAGVFSAEACLRTKDR